jgi:hypothetical protein
MRAACVAGNAWTAVGSAGVAAGSAGGGVGSAGGAAGSAGVLYKEPIISTLAVAGFMYKGKLYKNIDGTLIAAGVYAPYSKWDSFQVLDPQGAVPRRRYVRCIFTQSARCTHLQFIPLFSERRFPADSKVKHISVIRWFRPLSHVEFLFPSFTKKLEKMLIKAKDHDFSKKEMRYKL